jgi:hypothetical protein
MVPLSAWLLKSIILSEIELMNKPTGIKIKDKIARVIMIEASFPFPPSALFNATWIGYTDTAMMIAHNTGMINGASISKQ